MKKRLTGWILFLCLVAGAGLVLYPTVSDFWNSRHQSQAIADYAQALEELDQNRYRDLLNEAQAYNERISREGPDFFLNEEEEAAYEELLNVDGSGLLGYLEIDRICGSLPIYHGTSEGVLQVGVGHLAGTSLPLLAGENGTHCVLSGHRGLPSAKLLSDLDRLTEGDTFAIRTMDGVLTYEVDRIRIVLPSDVSELNVEPGNDLCTLVTCTPYGVNTHRLLVRGHRIETKDASAIRVISEAGVTDRTLSAILFAIPPLIVLLIWFLLDTARQTRINKIRKKLDLDRYPSREEGESN